MYGSRLPLASLGSTEEPRRPGRHRELVVTNPAAMALSRVGLAYGDHAGPTIVSARAGAGAAAHAVG
jgi:hypothetical protein